MTLQNKLQTLIKSSFLKRSCRVFVFKYIVGKEFAANPNEFTEDIAIISLKFVNKMIVKSRK